jgi:hypothetical protein
VHRESGSAGDLLVDENEVIEALGALEPVWDELYPAEQTRILRLMIERIDVAPDGISVTLHAPESGAWSRSWRVSRLPLPSLAREP